MTDELDAANLLGALLLGDGRLPVGGHTQSAGLEAAVLAGVPVDQVPAYLRLRIETVARVDAGTAVVALRALRAGTSRGPSLELVHAHWAARTPSHVQRSASALAAQGYLRLARRLATAPLPTCPPARPLALALLGDVLHLSPTAVAGALVHDEIQTVTSSALKLLPLDPAEVAAWAVRVHPVAATVVAEAARAVDVDDIPCPSAPRTEVWIHHHAESNRRLFSA